MASVFANFEPSEQDILGATCIILWGLTLIVIVKYCSECLSPRQTFDHEQSFLVLDLKFEISSHVILSDSEYLGLHVSNL